MPQALVERQHVVSVLHADSQRSLALQGGAMPADEAEAWRSQPHAADALRLRIWDDLAKDASWQPASREAAMAELKDLLVHL